VVKTKRYLGSSSKEMQYELINNECGSPPSPSRRLLGCAIGRNVNRTKFGSKIEEMGYGERVRSYSIIKAMSKFWPMWLKPKAQVFST